MEPKLLLIVPAIFGNLHAEKSYLLYRVKAPTAQIGNLTLIEVRLRILFPTESFTNLTITFKIQLKYELHCRRRGGLDVIYLQARQVEKSTVALVASSDAAQFENKLDRRRINFISKGSTLVQR